MVTESLGTPKAVDFLVTLEDKRRRSMYFRSGWSRLSAEFESM